MAIEVIVPDVPAPILVEIGGLLGPAGPTGATGATGSTGATGAQGPVGSVTLAAVLSVLGITTYADLTAANTALTIGSIFYNTALAKIDITTA